MSKVKKYIEDAVSEAARNIKTKGVEISNVTIDNGVHIDNGDLSDVLLELSRAQSEIARAIVAVSNSKPSINQGSAIELTGIGDNPLTFNKR